MSVQGTVVDCAMFKKSLGKTNWIVAPTGMLVGVTKSLAKGLKSLWRVNV